MELLSIGAFARAARLSPKALRLYDDLGLLKPYTVDPWSGYRHYHPDQLERARLVAWLRRLGMPLARIRQVADLPSTGAADAVADYWRQVVADTAARGQLATFLVEHLSGRGEPMSEPPVVLGVRYAARTDTGMVRTSNEDTAYAGSRLLAVADGVAGPAGARASAAAVEALKPLETVGVPAGEVLNLLAEAVRRTDRELRAIDGVTTLTALVLSGSRLALVHIGDTRAYLLRDGELRQVSHDHSHVQSLVDEGRLTPEEALSHPQRALLARALDGTGRWQPDLSLHDARPGDRYVLCSDGLTGVVPPAALTAAMTAPGGPDALVDRLVGLAYAAGAPDNIACVVADVVPV